MASRTRTVQISNADGLQYAVTEYNFYNKKLEEGKTYEELGFTIDRWEETGSLPYEAPEPAAPEPA